MSAAGRLFLVACLCGSPASFGATGTEDGNASCRAAPYRLLDFWLGEWEVRSGGAVVGRNRIRSILGGCAIREQWTGDASEGESLFYFHPPSGRWKQVWVTDRADRAGGLKEKTQASIDDPRVLRFEGEWPLPSGVAVRDRTTLRALDDGSVRQVIEVSSDGGTGWRTVFEGVYIRAADDPMRQSRPVR